MILFLGAMYIENCTCPVATHVSRQMDNVTWHVNCASETDSDKCDPETGVHLDCQHSHTGISREDNRDEKFLRRKRNAQILLRLGRKKSLNLIMCWRKKNFERHNVRLQSDRTWLSVANENLIIVQTLNKKITCNSLLCW